MNHRQFRILSRVEQFLRPRYPVAEENEGNGSTDTKTNFASVLSSELVRDVESLFDSLACERACAKSVWPPNGPRRWPFDLPGYLSRSSLQTQYSWKTERVGLSDSTYWSSSSPGQMCSVSVKHTIATITITTATTTVAVLVSISVLWSFHLYFIP